MRRTLLAAASLAPALLLACSLLAAGCASSGGTTSRERENLISLEEVQASRTNNAHDLIRQLRPRWLQAHPRISVNTPAAIVIFQDDMNLGAINTQQGVRDGLDALEKIPTELIRSVRLLSASEAQTLRGIGPQHVQHAIVVQTLRDPGRDGS